MGFHQVCNLDGTKLNKTSNATGTAVTTHYVDGIQYIGTSIDFIQTEEGLHEETEAVTVTSITWLII